MTKQLEAREELEGLEAEWVDGPELKAKVTLIKSGVSGNNREWPAAALEAASNAGFWDGTKMFLDHPERKGSLPSKILNRSVRDMVSAIESTEWVPTGNGEGKVIGEVNFFDEKFYDFAKRAQKHLGSSVNLLFNGKVVKRNNQRFEVVESLAHSKSVDWVAFPAAGGAIEEFIATEGEDDVEWDEVTVEMIRENRPDLVEAFESATPPPPSEDPPVAPPVDMTGYLTKDEMATAIREAREGWDRERQEADTARNSYSTRVKASNLPARTQARLMAAFESTYDEKKLDKEIEEARQELKEAGAGPKIHGLGVSTSTEGEGGKTLTEVAPLHSAMEGFFSLSSKNQEDSN